MMNPKGRLSDGEAAGLVMNRVDRDRTHDGRYAQERLWWENIAYYQGLQNSVWGSDNRLRKAKSPHRRSRVTNLILPVVIRSLAKLTSLDPFFTVAPASGDRADRQAARVAEKVRQHMMQRIDLESNLERMLLWAACTGSCFGKVFWDEDGGVPERFFFDREQDFTSIRTDLSAEEEQRYIAKGMYQDLPPGDVSFQVVNPYQARWDPNAREGGIEKCDWFALDMLVSRESASNEWGVDENELTPEDGGGNRTQTQWEDLVADMSSGFRRGVLASGSTGTRRNRTRVVEYWEKPTRRNDWKGRCIVMAGGKIVKNDDNPYGRYPFVKLDYFPCPGSFMGKSLVEQLRDPQKAYNENRSVIATNQQAYGRQQYWAHKQTEILPQKLTTEGGAINFYTGHMGPPQVPNIPSLPSEIANDHMVSRSEIQDIAGQTSLEGSKLPGQMRAGVGIRLMQSENDMILTAPARSMLRMTKDIGTQTLELVRVRYTRSRMFRVVGKDGEYQFGSFRGADLRRNTEVEVRGEVEQLLSRDSRVATVMDLLQMGFYDPQNPQQRRTVIESIGSLTDEHIILEEMLDQSNAERLIQDIIEDPVNGAKAADPWDNAEVYLQIMGRFFKTEEFRMLDDVRKKTLIEVWMSYEQQKADMMKAEFDMASQMRGGAGQKGQASQAKTPNRTT